MVTAIDAQAVGIEARAEIALTGDLLAELLRQQQSTAAEKFSQWHARETQPLQARYYRDLIPVSPPAAGEQYAFEVDLDCCSGCKACVAACHNLNGLEEGETWRAVGLLHGGTSQLPVVQHVTTACHHCLEPACLDGCPVLAYEKDPVTGIVRHRDDQCIGCQYCILKCPYDVPKYSHAKGIVRKCDMCSGRLAAGEAPACVQACPTRAIRITVVSQDAAAENAEANLFLPGAPEPGYTLPTTVYKTTRPLPANLLPADYYRAAPQHAHWPLILMLVLTQMSVGTLVVDQMLSMWELAAGREVLPAVRGLQLAAALGLGMLGLAAATFHLGRPWLAYRAVLGWRTSWLSREALALGAFAAAAAAYAATAWLSSAGLPLAGRCERIMGAVVAATGLAGVACSAMIYASTRRAFWNPAYTGLKFLLTCLVLGIPVALLMRLVAAAWPGGGAEFELPVHTRYLVQGLLIAGTTKLLAEAAIFSWLRTRTLTPLRRTAILMTRELDRFLANIQRGGLYSVVPRVPGGEITPNQLIALGRIAKKYGLYTKITGGQRVDLFGAQVQQLPDIWEEVIAAGMESGHAYGKAVRTVKSSVGSTWCRYGVQDSVGLAIRIEKRYRGIRAPHKIKGAVSGCIRECAEAQSKDFGLIATEKGYNLYVCGNGGAKPRHADLLAADLDEATAVQYLDRFLMFYIQTADRLTRTSVWLESLPGGIQYLRDVILGDRLGICDELERQMQHLVDTYRCEWSEVVRDPHRRKLFQQFVNTDQTQPGIEIITERGQNRPADWPKDGALVQLEPSSRPRGNGRPKPRDEAQTQWIAVGRVADFPDEGGAAVKYGQVQIAVFHFTSREQWYACQNMCPHKRAFVLSRGIIGSQGQVPKVACPLHKKTFSLDTGECLSGEEMSVKVFPVKVVDDQVYLYLPPVEQLNALLATGLHCVTAGEPLGASTTLGTAPLPLCESPDSAAVAAV